MKLTEVNCVICGSGRDESKVIYTEFGLTIVRCNQCGLVYVNPRPSDVDLDALYGRNQELTHPGQVREDKTRHATIYPSFERKLGQLRLRRVARIRHGRLGRLLDIGCQHGLFLNLAQSAGWIPVGVEMTTEFAASARNTFGLEVYNDKVESIKFGNQKFDLITLLDVFEHLQDPNAVLETVRNILNDDGLLLIKVPNVTFIQLKTFVLRSLLGKDAHEKHDFVNPLGYWMAQEHLYNFSDKTLRQLLFKHGFRRQKSYFECPSIYGAFFLRDAVQMVVWVCSIFLHLFTLGHLNIGRSLVHVYRMS